jgi:hypothetical protein
MWQLEIPREGCSTCPPTPSPLLLVEVQVRHQVAAAISSVGRLSELLPALQLQEGVSLAMLLLVGTSLAAPPSEVLLLLQLQLSLSSTLAQRRQRLLPQFLLHPRLFSHQRYRH